MDLISSLVVGLAHVMCESMNMRGNRGDHTDLKQAINDLETAISELKAIRDDLSLRFQQDELEGRSRTNRAINWLNAVEAAEIKTDSVLARFKQKEQRTRMRKRFLGCFCCGDYKLWKKVSAMLKTIRELRERSEDVMKTDGGGSIQQTSREIPMKRVVGSTATMERVLEILCREEEESGIIGVYGPGGVGKTTLMQRINNELITNGHHHQYDVLIWVTMSREFSECTIQQAVGARLGLSWDEKETGESRATKIYRALRQKRFLLLVDDVWEEINLEKTGVPRPDKENKCKMIFTTRSMAVCSDMRAEYKLKVEFLGKQDAWELFCDKVGRRDIVERPSIRRLAEIIVSKCGGLPLALITLGAAMAHRETEEEWIHASEVLKTFPAEMKGMSYVFAVLKFSYDNLESDLLRSCFLYCALFPEEHSIEIEQLVEYWIGEGFLVRSNGVNTLYKGYFLIGDLKAACLLETGDEKTHVKMHNMVRSFALWMASEQGAYKEMILVEPSMGLTESPKAESWRQALVISLLDNKIHTLPETPLCPRLTTLLLQKNGSLKTIPIDFFMHMPVLRVLDLSFTSITEIPTSIKYLAELYHLAMSGTKISVLPEELRYLKKLKHLNLQRTQFLQTIPRDAICWLRNLEVLNLYYSYAGWELWSCSEEDEVDELGFADLEHLENLTTIGVTVLSLETLNTLYEFGTLHKRIQNLHVEECNGLQYFDLASLTNLRRLSIKSCSDLEYLIPHTDDETGWLQSLEVLTLQSLHKLSRVWGDSVNQESLRNLRCINISHCHKVKNISWVPQLPKLEVIDLYDCRELEELVSDCESSSVEDLALWFPSLKTLSIRELPKLSSILPCRFFFRKLETLVVANCSKVKKLPFQERVETNLPTVYCDKKWWDELEEDQVNKELCCLPHFFPN